MVHSVQGGRANQHLFSLAPQIKTPRSSFDLSHGHKTTFDEGYLIPVYVDEVLPGDTFNVNMQALCRLSTPIYPIMSNLYFETMFFFVPNRLIWSHWEEFNGQQANTNSSTDYLVPTITAPMGGFSSGSLYDYMGIPIGVADFEIDAFWTRAYNLIYNEWYRDENLQNSVVVDLDDGPDTYSDYVVLRRGKRHDYFTSCLPWPQKINDGTVVEIPLGSTAPVVGIGTAVGTAWDVTAVNVRETPDVTRMYSGGGTVIDVTGNRLYVEEGETGFPAIYADLSEATAATINQLRQAFQLQVLFERDARGGTRYTEVVRAHFNVISPDQRLQRPEYLGGGSTPFSINTVAQTSGTGISDQDTPQGNLSAFGVCHFNKGHGFTKSFTEHGVIIGIATVRADLDYQQGVHRMWSRQTRYDFYWPALAHIGEQAVLNKEIYVQGTSDDDDVFGYQERYAEYRYKPSIISGLFRSAASGTLDSWHLAQNFGALPVLNSTFIVENAPMSRIEAVSSEPDFLCDMFFNVKAARVMPLYGTPMQLGRF